MNGRIIPLALVGLLAACRQSAPPEAAAAPRSVEAVAVHSGPAQAAVAVTGRLASRDEARLSFRVGGIIRSIGVRQGAAVKAGQLLAELVGTEVDARAEQARQAHAKAERDLQRGRKLYADDVITREQLDDLGTAEAASRAALDAVEFDRRYARIEAPEDGRVLARLADEREQVAPGQPVLLVSRSGRGLILRAALAEADVASVHAGDPASLRFDALPGRAFEGRVSEVGRTADPGTGTYALDIEVAPPQGGAEAAGLISGMIGRAELQPRSGAGAQRDYVPLEALVEGGQHRARIYLLQQDGRVREQYVAVAFIAGGDAALEQPLAPGSRVVTAGSAYLRDGEQVRLAQAPAAERRPP
jgi:RND family efflux transporter MFP subunit